MVVNVFPINKFFVRSQQDQKRGLPGTLQGELLFAATGIWLFDDYDPPRPLGHEHMLVDMCRSNDWNVDSDFETIRGSHCQVLRHSQGNDSIWIDPAKGYCVTKRVLGPDERPTVVLELGGHREVGRGVWLPGWISNRQFDVAGNVVMDAIATILSREVNTGFVAQVFEPSDGFVEMDYADATRPIRGFGDGRHHLDDMIGWIDRNSLRSGDAGLGSGEVLAFTGGFLCGLSVGYWVCVGGKW